MFLNPDASPLRRQRHACHACVLVALAATLLAGCSWLPFGKGEEEAANRPAAPAASPPQRAASAVVSPQPPAPAVPVAAPDQEALARMLAYAERVRLMPAAELNPEATRLGEQPGPASQLQLALVLSQLRQLPELVRAQELLARVLGNADAEAQALHPLARLLAARYGEQRRVEEQLEKQAQQTREVQRRLDQTNERLEALKAIERSLTTRPAASAPLPNHRNNPTAP